MPHFGQTIGSLLRSKNFAPQVWHWRLLPSSGFATFSLPLEREWTSDVRAWNGVCPAVYPVAPVSRALRRLSNGESQAARRLMTSAAGACYERNEIREHRGQMASRTRVSRSTVAGSSHGPAQPLTARRVRPSARQPEPAGRQVDLPPRADLRPAGQGRDADRGPAGGRGRAAHRRRLPGPGRAWWSDSARALAGRRARASARCSQPQDVLDFGNAGTGTRLMMGVVGGHADHGDVRWRRLAAQAADAAHPRSAGADGRRSLSARPRAGAAPSTLRGTAEPAPIEYRSPVAVRAAQIRRSCSRA